MSNSAVFDENVERYERWFDAHSAVYMSELLALRACIPVAGKGLEIGVGTGRFAAPLGIETGIDPSLPMGKVAQNRGIEVIEGVAEKLPWQDGTFDYALAVTTICFVDDPVKMMAEAKRVLRPGGLFIVGFVDIASEFGKGYLEKRSTNTFYKVATFYSAKDIETLMKNAGFQDLQWGQVLFGPINEINQIQPVQQGHGKGSFVVVCGTRP